MTKKIVNFCKKSFTKNGLEIFQLVCSAAHADKRGPAKMDFTREQLEAVKNIRAATDNFQRLSLNPGNKSVKVSLSCNFFILIFV